MTELPPPAPAPRRRKGLLAIGLSVVGAALMFWGFAAGIGAALSGSGGGAGFFVGLFFFGAAAVLMGLVLGAVGLVKRRDVALSAVAVALALVPAIAVVILAVNARG